MENGETPGKICPIMSSQGNFVYCREDCAWFSDICLMPGWEKTKVEGCVIQLILREIANIANWRK